MSKQQDPQDYVTKNELATQLTKLREDIREDIRKDTTQIVADVATQILTVVADRFDQVDARMDRMDGRMNGIEGRLGGLEDKVDSLATDVRRINLQLDPLTETIHSHGRRLTILESQAA
jgi:chromosome segregation ATPase